MRLSTTTVAIPELEAHPHARAVLGPVIAAGRRPSHAYLFHGPAGSGKRELARALAAELLARDVNNPASARTRVEHGVHPDLTWVTPSGAHEMLRGDIDEAVVSAATRTPFEARFRVFVLERVETMNDEAANRLLKTLEEPADYVVLLLLTTRPSDVMPTIASRCQAVRFDALDDTGIAARLAGLALDADTALACARLCLGDLDKGRLLAGPGGSALRGAAEGVARGAVAGKLTGSPALWRAVLSRAAAAADAVEAELLSTLADELEMLPKKDRKRRETEYGERIRRARRRANTGTLDHALELIALWFRDIGCVLADAPELVLACDRLDELRSDAARVGSGARAREAIELVEDTRVRLVVNVTEELACEALGFRLQRLCAAGE